MLVFLISQILKYRLWGFAGFPVSIFPSTILGLLV